MRTLRLALAALFVLAAFFTAAPRSEASNCPIYQQCMILYPEGWCLCEGFYCNGEFICGIPFN
jgi:hypothetical protein